MGNRGVTEDGQPPKEKTISEIFHEAFPHYLVMGMTYEQFWDGDSGLVKDYRKAFKLQQELEQEKLNQFAWLQGMYIYEALCDVSPVLHAFAKSGTKPLSYSEKPYELKPREDDKPSAPAQNEQEAQIKRNVAMMQSLAAAFNKNFRKREEEKRLRDGADEVASQAHQEAHEASPQIHQEAQQNDQPKENPPGEE